MLSNPFGVEDRTQGTLAFIHSRARTPTSESPDHEQRLKVLLKEFFE
jgi:hypothetical protein